MVKLCSLAHNFANLRITVCSFKPLLRRSGGTRRTHAQKKTYLVAACPLQLETRLIIACLALLSQTRGSERLLVEGRKDETVGMGWGAVRLRCVHAGNVMGC
jgi:hypothetical protein